MSSRMRIAWLDILKFLGMYFVVLGHAISDPSPDSHRFYIYAFHMPLFFIISGMAFYLQINNKSYSIKEMIKNKINGLIIPYFILSFITFFIWLIFNHSLALDSESIKKILGIFYSNQNVFKAASNELWFVPTLFLTTITFFVLLKWAKKDDKILTLTILAITSIGYTMSIQKYKHALPWHLDTVTISLLFFLIGYLFFKHLDKIKVFLGNNKRQIIMILIILPIAFLFARYNVKISMHSNTYGSFLNFMISSLGFSLILIIIAMKLPNYKVMNLIGRNTLVYLAFHAPILRFFKSFSSTSETFFNEHSIILGSIVFIILIPIAYIFEKYFPYLIGRSKTKLFKI